MTLKLTTSDSFFKFSEYLCFICHSIQLFKGANESTYVTKILHINTFMWLCSSSTIRVSGRTETFSEFSLLSKQKDNGILWITILMYQIFGQIEIM